MSNADAFHDLEARIAENAARMLAKLQPVEEPTTPRIRLPPPPVDPALVGLVRAVAVRPWPEWFDVDRLVLADWLAERDDARAVAAQAMRLAGWSARSSGGKRITEQLVDVDGVIIHHSESAREWLLDLFPEVELRRITFRQLVPDYDVWQAFGQVRHALNVSESATKWVERVLDSGPLAELAIRVAAHQARTAADVRERVDVVWPEALKVL